MNFIECCNIVSPLSGLSVLLVSWARYLLYYMSNQSSNMIKASWLWPISTTHGHDKAGYRAPSKRATKQWRQLKPIDTCVCKFGSPGFNLLHAGAGGNLLLRVVGCRMTRICTLRCWTPNTADIANIYRVQEASRLKYLASHSSILIQKGGGSLT